VWLAETLRWSAAKPDARIILETKSRPPMSSWHWQPMSASPCLRRVASWCDTSAQRTTAEQEYISLSIFFFLGGLGPSGSQVATTLCFQLESRRRSGDTHPRVLRRIFVSSPASQLVSQCLGPHVPSRKWEVLRVMNSCFAVERCAAISPRSHAPRAGGRLTRPLATVLQRVSRSVRRCS